MFVAVELQTSKLIINEPTSIGIWSPYIYRKLATAVDSNTLQQPCWLRPSRGIDWLASELREAHCTSVLVQSLLCEYGLRRDASLGSCVQMPGWAPFDDGEHVYNQWTDNFISIVNFHQARAKYFNSNVTKLTDPLKTNKFLILN